MLVPDAYGLDDFTKAEADRLANQGYLVLAVDIYNGKQTTDPGDLANLIANMNAATVMKTIDAGIRFFHESPKFTVGHVVAMGWGTGATYVFQAARESKTLDGAITFYGPIEGPEHVLGKFPAAALRALSDERSRRHARRGALVPAADEGRRQRLRVLVHRGVLGLVQSAKQDATTPSRTRRRGRSRCRSSSASAPNLCACQRTASSTRRRTRLRTFFSRGLQPNF